MGFFAITLCTDRDGSVEDIEKYIEEHLESRHGLIITGNISFSNCFHLKASCDDDRTNEQIQELIVEECYSEDMRVQVAVACCE